MADRRKQAKVERDANVEPLPILREVGGVDHVPSVCMTLRMARERAGYDLKDVATILRIKSSHLEALEAGRYKDLPGPTYVSGFLRTYADYLGLDRNEILARYREEIGLGSRQKLTFPTPNYERRVPRGWLVIAGLAVVAIAYGGWHYYSTQNSKPADLVADAPSDASSDPKLAAGANLAAERAEGAKSVEVASNDAAAAKTDEKSAAQPAAASLSANKEQPASTGAGGSLFNRDASSSSASGASDASGATDAASSAGSAGKSKNLFDQSSAPSSSSPTVAAAGSALTTDANAAAPGEGEAAGNRLDVPVADADDELPLVAPSPDGTTPAATAAAETTVASLEASGTEVVPTQADSEPTSAMAEPTVSSDGAPTEGAAAVPTVAEARIVISAKADSWVQISGPGNELIMTQILRPGERYSVPDREGLVLVTGNAGGLELIVDGQTMRALGPIGVVKRNIALNPETLRSKYAP